MQKIDHTEWSPATKLYYGKYHTAIRVGPFPYHSPAYLPKHLSGYRIVHKWQDSRPARALNIIYTDNQDVINYIMDDAYLRMNIVSVTGVYNQEHYDFLRDKDRNVLIRENLWYNEYIHKMEVYKTWIQKDTTSDDANRAIDYIFDTFVDSRINTRGGQKVRDKSRARYHPIGSSSWVSVPTVFTNNEAGIFLFKMAFSEKFIIKVSSVVRLQNVLDA